MAHVKQHKKHTAGRVEPSRRKRNRTDSKVKISLAIVTVLLSDLILSNVPISDDFIWYWHDLGQSARLIVMSALVTYLLPYRMLAAKTLALCYTAASVVEWLFSFYWYVFDAYNENLAAWQAGVCAVVSTYYMLRRYDVRSDPLNDDHMFLVYTKPDDAQSFILSLCGRAVGGVGVYARGNWWHFHHGKLVRSKLPHSVKRVTIQSVAYDRHYVEELTRLEGLTWSSRTNCVTVILRRVVMWRIRKFIRPLVHYSRP